MVVWSWRQWLNKTFGVRAKVRQSGPRSRRVLLLETLESRLVPSTVFTVNNTNDGDVNTTFTGSVAPNLRSAVAKADLVGGAVTISLTSGATYKLNNVDLPLGEMVVESQGNTPLTLTVTTRGAGMAAIDANLISRIFHVMGDNGGATLNVVNIDLNRGEATGGDFGDFGGGVFVETGGTFNLRQGQITNCISLGSTDSTGVGQGGAIYNSGTVTIRNSKIMNNEATSFDGSDGGAAGAARGGAIYDAGSLTIINSTLGGNTAQGGQESSGNANLAGGAAGGGGIYAARDAAISITGSIFSANKATGGDTILSGGEGAVTGAIAQGGAIYVVGSSIPLSITGSSFENNQATGGQGQTSGSFLTATGGAAQGGAVYLAFGQNSLATDRFQGNKATGGAGNGTSGAVGNGGVGQGGAIYQAAGGEGFATLTAALLQGNQATGGSGNDGGQPGVGQGGAIFNTGDLTIISSQIRSNTASAPLLILGAQIVGDSASVVAGFGTDATGGGIFDSGNLAIQNSTLSGNTAAGGGSSDITDSTGGAGKGGGLAVMSGGGFLLLTGSTFSGNRAVGGSATLSGGEGTAAGGPALGAGVFWAAGGEGLLANDTFAFNTATGGGAINNNGSAFGGGAEGGAVYFDESQDGTLDLADNTVAYNSAAGGTGGSGNGQGRGGGMFSTAPPDATFFNLINNLVAKNTDNAGNPDLSGGFNSDGHNLIGNVTGGNDLGTFSTANHDIFGGGEGGPVNPRLDTQLRNNGGPTQTIALLPGSKAIDHAAFLGGLSTDQRAVHRPQGLFPDIGAYEFAHPSLSEFYRVPWNPTPSSNNFITGNLLTPLLQAGLLPRDLASGTTLTVFVPKPPPGFSFKPDGSFVYKPPVGFSQSIPPLSFQFGVLINGEDFGVRFNVFIVVARGARLGQPT